MSMAGCFLTPKVIFSVLSILSMALGFFSAFLPARSIAFYQWIMKRFNWKVTPIDAAKELRNTKILGIGLAMLGMLLAAIVHGKFCS